MIRDTKHETMSRGDLKKLQGERLAALVARVYEKVPFYKALLQRGRGSAGGHHDRGGRCETPLHLQAGPARLLPLRALRRAPQGDRADPRLFWHHRQAHHSGLHQRRHRHVGRVHGPHLCRSRCHRRRHHPERLRLRPLHRRPGRPLRGGTPRRLGHPHLGRQHAEAADAHAGLRHDGAVLHAQLRPLYLRRGRGDGRRPPQPARCAWASSARSPGRRTCGARSKRS